MLGTLADIVGILSFILTIILLVRSERLRNEIVSQKIDYRNQQTKIVDRLTELRSCLQNNEPLSVKTISEIRLELYQCDISFQHILSSRDKKIVKQTINLLNEEFSEKLRKQLLSKLDYLCARFSKTEV